MHKKFEKEKHKINQRNEQSVRWRKGQEHVDISGINALENLESMDVNLNVNIDCNCFNNSRKCVIL